MFSHFPGGLKDMSPHSIVDITILQTLIRHNPYQEKILELHQMPYRSAQYDEKKITFPYITPHGVFERYRDNKHLSLVSQYLYYDVDFSQTQCFPDEAKKKLLCEHSDKICLISRSIGGRGIFFLVRDENITLANFNELYHYYKYQVFGSWPTDNNAKGLSRPMFIPYDPDVYYQDVSVSHSKNIISTETNTISQKLIDRKNDNELKGVSEPIKNKEKRGYRLKYTFTDIRELFKKYHLKTQVPVIDPIADIKPETVIETYIPRTIKDGSKHTTFRTITNRMMLINPDITLIDIQSFINYINLYYTDGKPMQQREMLKTVQAAYIKTKKEGILLGRYKVKNIHFNPSCGLSGDEKKRYAAKANGKLKKRKSIEKIDRAIKQLEESRIKVTKKKIAELSGLSLSTVNIHWKQLDKNINPT